MSRSSQLLKAGFETVDVVLGAARLTLHVAGDGRPLVLFHSLLADRTSFDPVASALAETHRVIALDLPGFGGSTFVEGGLEAIADRIAAALETLGLTDRPIFLGNGYGGFVALMTAIRHANLAEGLVLADCGATFDEQGRAAFRGMSAAAEKGGLAAVADVAMRRLFAPGYQAQHPELIAQRKERFMAVEPLTFHSACQALSTIDLRSQLTTVRVPVLVVVGEMDEATPPPMSSALAAGLPDAKLIVLPGCAHVPQLQDPMLFLATISEFVGRVPRDGAGALPG